MKRIALFFVCLLGITPLAPGQDTAAAPVPPSGPSREEMQENYNSLKGQVQDLMDSQAQLQKRLQDLSQQISDLRDQQSKPGNYASADDLKKLADEVQDLDKKREADKQLILEQIDKLGKAMGAAPTHIKTSSPEPTATESTAATGSEGGGDETGYNYVVKSGDTISAIAKAYRQQEGIKVSVDQILKANPGLNAAHLRVGQKIFIPAPKGTKTQ